METPASAMADETEEESALEKLSITLIFLLVMSTAWEGERRGWGAGREGSKEMLEAVSSEELGWSVSGGAVSVWALTGWRSEESWGDGSRGSWGGW